MKAAGFGAIFCNVKDFSVEAWERTRYEAAKAGIICGPWSRMCSGDPGSEYDPALLFRLVDLAHQWGTPYIVNGEDELEGHDEHSREIVQVCGDDDWAFSMIAWPFNDNDWSMFRDVPVLPQLFGPEYGRQADEYRAGWQARGVSCVVHTFGTYSGWTPDMYPLASPYGLYTADDCGGDFARWRPTGTCTPCAVIPPGDNGDVEVIGPNHGVTASVNRLRDRDPGGTLLQKDGNKWPPLSSLTQPVDEWKAYDKLERSLTILVRDHDEAAAG